MLSRIKQGIKSRKSNSSGSSKSKASDDERSLMLRWVYDSDPPVKQTETFQYLMSPTAPAEKTSSSYIATTYKVDCNVEIISRAAIRNFEELINIASCLIDSYDGQLLIKPWIVSVYLTIVTHLVKEPDHHGVKSSVNRYHNGFTEILTLYINKNFAPENKKYSFKKNLSATHKGNQCNIIINIELSPTDRKGKSIKDVYEVKMPDNREIPNFDQMILPYNLKAKEKRGKYLITHKMSNTDDLIDASDSDETDL
ncbi:matrix protein [Beatrice Hill virus]|uniref:Matrix protein n=1 Tax=Beatrice Hill virus TaxID=1819301 RepID=A0A1J0F5G7_9RHAB|nr:matrix protein [Beatrice Hill virus]APC23640.1 matrix protein [Beatrice Hill virus]